MQFLKKPVIDKLNIYTTAQSHNTSKQVTAYFYNQ